MGVTVPLNLDASVPSGYIIVAQNTGNGGHGLRAVGGDRGIGVSAKGGIGNGNNLGGPGITAFGGDATGTNRGGNVLKPSVAKA